MRHLARRGYKTYSVEDALDKGIPPSSICLTFDDGFVDYYFAAQTLEQFGMRGQVFLVSEKLGGYNDWDTAIGDISAPLLGGHHVLALRDKGHWFGSHTATHADLSAVPIKDQTLEIDNSRVTLSRLLGTPVRTFCYPYGRFGVMTREIVEQSGYDFALSTQKGINDVSTDRLMLKRIAIRNDTILPVFIYKLYRAVRFGR